MTEFELLAELIDDLHRDLRPEIETLTTEEFHWHPGAQANSIAVTVWHIGRGLDFLATRVLQGNPAEEELWITRGWSEKTGYDPHGKGYGGWGVVTGYTWQEVQDIPELSTGEALEYLQQSCCAVSGLVRALDPEKAQSAVPDFLGGKLTTFRWVTDFYKGFQAHVGEIVAIKARLAHRKDANG